MAILKDTTLNVLDFLQNIGKAIEEKGECELREKSWSRDKLKISYSNPMITPFYEYSKEEKGEVERPVKSIKDAMYFYYHIDIFDGDKKMFSAGTHDNPKVQDLPAYIDYIMQFNMKKHSYVIDEVKDECGFHRKIQYAQIILEDSFIDIEYSYKIERYDYAVKQSDEKKHKKWTDYTLTISEMGNKKTSFGNAVVIKNISPKELNRLKETAIAFCEQAVIDYNKDFS